MFYFIKGFSSFLFLSFFPSCYVIQPGLEFIEVLLPQIFKCWDYRCIPPCLASKTFSTSSEIDLFCAILKSKSRASCLVSKCSACELQPALFHFILTGFWYIVQTDLEFMILLNHCPKYLGLQVYRGMLTLPPLKSKGKLKLKEIKLWLYLIISY